MTPVLSKACLEETCHQKTRVPIPPAATKGRRRFIFRSKLLARGFDTAG